MTLSHYKVRQIMKKAGARRISRDAVELMSALLEDHCRELTAKALLFAENSMRTTLMKKDLELTQLEIGEQFSILSLKEGGEGR
jgi:histone H3/H4